MTITKLDAVKLDEAQQFQQWYDAFVGHSRTERIFFNSVLGCVQCRKLDPADVWDHFNAVRHSHPAILDCEWQDFLMHFVTCSVDLTHLHQGISKYVSPGVAYTAMTSDERSVLAKWLTICRTIREEELMEAKEVYEYCLIRRNSHHPLSEEAKNRFILMASASLQKHILSKAKDTDIDPDDSFQLLTPEFSRDLLFALSVTAEVAVKRLQERLISAETGRDLIDLWKGALSEIVLSKGNVLNGLNEAVAAVLWFDKTQTTPYYLYA